MKRWLALSFTIHVLSGTPLAAQTRAADSLRALLTTDSRLDTLRVRRLQALGNEVINDLPQAIAILEQALALSRRLPDPRGEGQALIRLGTFYRLRDDYPQARRYAQQALALFTRRADAGGLSKAYLQLSFIDLQLGDPPSSLLAALRGLPYAEQAGDRMTQTRLQLAIAGAYVQVENYPDALPLLNSVLKNGRALGDEYTVAPALSLLGTTHQMLKKWPQALAYFQRSIALNRKLGDTESVATDEINEAELYLQEGNNEQAVAHASYARALARANKDVYSLPSAELALARAFLASQRPDSAIALAQHGFRLSQPTHRKENLRSASDILAQAYAQQRDYPRAYRYQRLWVAYKDSVSGQHTQLRTVALRYGYELDKKQAQIALLTKTRQLQAQREARQRQQLYGLLAGLFGTVLVAGLLGHTIRLKQRTNRALNEKNDHIARQRDDLNHALLKLKATQNQLVQSEKMVALAALTAGVAHEIQNPLNFINNFSEVSIELIAELEEEKKQPVPDAASEAELLNNLKQNLHKIHQHGSRAGNIVRGMLEQSHNNTGQRQPVDLNALAQEYLRLADHSQQDNVKVRRTCELDPTLGLLQLVPQEIGRVLLNLFTNAFYSVQQKAKVLGAFYVPEVRVCTRRLGTHVELRVRDNGVGIPAAVIDKIYDPFFTTKPPGDGTGLGLWLSYDLVTKGYGGTLTVATQEGEFAEFTLTLPCTQLVLHAAPCAAAS